MIASAVMRAKHEGGAKIIVADPRRTELAARADLWLRLRPGSNVALLNSIAHVILDEGLADLAFIEARTENSAPSPQTLRLMRPRKPRVLPASSRSSSGVPRACTAGASAACCSGVWELPSI